MIKLEVGFQVRCERSHPSQNPLVSISGYIFIMKNPVCWYAVGDDNNDFFECLEILLSYLTDMIMIMSEN